MIGTLQQIIPGKVPEGDLSICHIPGTCIINLQNSLMGIIYLSRRQLHNGIKILYLETKHVISHCLKSDLNSQETHTYGTYM